MQVSEMHFIEFLQEGDRVMLEGSQVLRWRFIINLVQVCHWGGLPVPQDVVFKFIPATIVKINTYSAMLGLLSLGARLGFDLISALLGEGFILRDFSSWPPEFS